MALGSSLSGTANHMPYNGRAGVSLALTGKFTLDKSGSPTKSVIVLEMKDGKPVYNTTVQPK